MDVCGGSESEEMAGIMIDGTTQAVLRHFENKQSSFLLSFALSVLCSPCSAHKKMRAMRIYMLSINIKMKINITFQLLELKYT